MKNFFLTAVMSALCCGFFAGCVAGRGQHPHTTLFDTVDGRLRPGIVKVRITPEAAPDGRKSTAILSFDCPNCKSRHNTFIDTLIENCRYLELPGYVMENGDIITVDPGFCSEQKMHLEVVGASGEAVSVSVAAYFPDRKAVALRTADGGIPAGSEPLVFKKPLPETSLFDYYYVSEEGIWVSGISPHNPGRYSKVPAGAVTTADFTSPQSIVTDPAGNPVTVILSSECDIADEYLMTAPESWLRISAEEMKAGEEKIRQTVRSGIFPVHFTFRPVDLRQERIDGNADPTLDKNHEDAVGILMPDGTVMVTSEQSPDMTARITSVTIDTPEKSIEGEFVRALEDYNIIFIRPLEKIADTGTPVYADNIIALYSKKVWGVSVENYGDEYDVELHRGIIEGVMNGYNNVPAAIISGKEDNDYIFTDDGELVALNVSVRQPVMNGRVAHSVSAVGSVPAAALMLAADSRVIMPKTPGERLNFDWLGIETRLVNEDLAAAYSASAFTGNGSHGIVISKVYPATPAETAGLVPGDIILSIRDHRNRLFIMDHSIFDVPDWEGNFMWDDYDSIPENQYDSIPTPWVNQRTPLNLLLTQLGPEAEVTVNYARDGELCSTAVQAEAAPPCFENAPRTVISALGLTVLDPTVEVRDYFRLAADEPGVLIARVRSGSKASVAGLMPYEIITAVNDKAVTGAAGFAAALEELGREKSEVVLTVRRLGVSRLVTMRTGR